MRWNPKDVGTFLVLVLAALIVMLLFLTIEPAQGGSSWRP